MSGAGSSRLRRRRAAAATAGVVAAVLLAACGGPPLPNTVVPGSEVSVGWNGAMSSTNTASIAGRTAGNLDVAALTRSQFAELVDGSVVVDEAFGSVTITSRDPFTVSYDLTEPEWSDGIPLDAADLLLAWAAGSNGLAPADFTPDAERDDDGVLQLPEDAVWFDSVATGLRSSDTVPTYDEFGRSIEVTFGAPVEDWQTALDVAVPAHVAGQRAFGLTDPMEAKQAVITAITDGDDVALADLARVWSTDFRLGTSSEVPDDLLLSSGPYVVTEVDQSQPDAQRVRLTVNRRLTSESTGTFETFELRQTPASEQLGLVENTLDVVQITPAAASWEQVRDLGRRDYGVTASHDGSAWMLVLRTDEGDFRWPAAREAFFSAIPRNDLSSAGAGRWSSYQQTTDVVLFPAGTQGYDIAMEDAGFRDRYDLSETEAIAAREAAGVEEGTGICVLYDSGSEYAAAAYAALAAGVAEKGWTIEDCGTDDVGGSRGDPAWEAVLTPLPVPTSAAQIQTYWGSDGARSWSAVANEDRDALIAELARTTDPYEARDLRVQIEATIVADAVALPIAMSLRITVAGPQMLGASSRSGPVASLTGSVTDWGTAGS